MDGISEPQHNLDGHIDNVEVLITWLELRSNMRYTRRYISVNGCGAHTRTNSKMSAHYMTHKLQRLCVHLLLFARAIAHARPPTRFALTLRVEWPKSHQDQILLQVIHTFGIREAQQSINHVKSNK
jgi:hypothetical protein